MSDVSGEAPNASNLYTRSKNGDIVVYDCRANIKTVNEDVEPVDLPLYKELDQE